MRQKYSVKEIKENLETIKNIPDNHICLSSKKLFISGLLCLLSITFAFGQVKQYTENNKDQSLRGAGRVNNTSLAMEFDLPMGNYPGRGISLPINLNYSSKVWRLSYASTNPRNNSGCYSVINPEYAEYSASGWTTSLGTPYIEYTGDYHAYDSAGNIYNFDVVLACDPGNTDPAPPLFFIKRITLHLPSGETHELRLSDSPTGQGNTWDGTYYAVDGSNIRFFQDSANGIYRALMPDGSFYDFSEAYSGRASNANKFTDRNGNYITYHAATSSYPNGYWTDTLGRNIAIPLNPTAPSTAGAHPYTYPGIDGDITYTLHWKSLKGSTAADSALTDFNQSLRYQGDKYFQSMQWHTRTSGTYLFGSEWDSWIIALNSPFNPIVLSEIELPTGEKYKFTYNVYGEIERIYYPTGSEERFEYQAVSSVSYLESPYSQANRGVTNRKVYEAAGTGTPAEWEYQSSGAIVGITNPDDTKIIRFLHAGYTDAPYGFDNVLSGKAFREFSFSSTGVLQTQKLSYWTKSTGERHPRVVREEDIIYNSSGSGLSSTVISEYEGNLSYQETPVLMNKTTSYAFETRSDGNTITPTSLPTATPPTIPSSPPPTPVRITEATYLINDTNYSSTIRDAYKNQNMVGLVTMSKVKNGSGTIVSQGETIFDESGSSPGYRANPTTAKIWDSTKGAVTNSSAVIATHAKFDSYGNQYESTDALGNVTTTTYDSTYHVFPLSVSSPVADTNGTYGSNSAFVTSATFDVDTGLPLTATDANGQVTQLEYDSDTLRTIRTTEPNGRKTEYEYGVPDSSGVYASSQRFVKIKTQIDAINWKQGYSWFDGLGRNIKSQSIDSNGDVFVETEYDIMGRVKRTTNPYRTGETKQWTTPTYDDFGRTTLITLPDSSTIATAYGVSTSGIVGLTKMITDQAGRKRKGFSDALGRMVRVVEDPDSQNLSTDYIFDTLGNLRKTTQGDQNRYFMHDSLGRLLYAKQVEQDANSAFSGSSYTDPITSNNQWSVKYEYDDNGNLTKTTDANNIHIQGTYDHLNRLILRNYSDTTPDVTFYYDGRGLSSVPNYSKGKMTKVSSSVSESKYSSFDTMGNLLTHQQIIDGQTYSTAYSYNLSGALIEETYPSGRVVKNTVNQDGELSMVQSKKNANNGFFTYAKGFSYTSAGDLAKMRLGNGRWETYSYNNRSQITQIGLGTVDSTQDLLKLEFGYNSSGNTDNNGSVLSQKITVPTVGSNAGFAADQAYIYDSLNRLQSATETISSSQTWKQTFTYDRYGNRRFDAANTTTPGSCTTAVCNPTISTSNNRFSTGQGYSYDANGSLTQDGEGKRFGYDSNGRQKEFFASTNGSSTPDATYYYDGEGRRVKKISTTEITVFVYNAAGLLVAEYSTALAQTQQVNYLTSDHLGSPRIITNENGAVTERQDYSAFGDETYTSQRISGLGYMGVNEIRQDYTGYQKDTESGLNYAQARYYNAQLGRFTTVDPLAASAAIRNPQTFNRYSYALNSPYKFTDPLGLLPLTSAGACGQFCNNSGDYVDGSAFRGKDKALLDIFERMASQNNAPPPPRVAEGNADTRKNPKISVAEVAIDNKGEVAPNSSVNGTISISTTTDVPPQSTVTVVITRTTTSIPVLFANPNRTDISGDRVEVSESITVTGTVDKPGSPVVIPFRIDAPDQVGEVKIQAEITKIEGKDNSASGTRSIEKSNDYPKGVEVAPATGSATLKIVVPVAVPVTTVNPVPQQQQPNPQQQTTPADKTTPKTDKKPDNSKTP